MNNWGKLLDRESKIVCSPSALICFREDPEIYKLRYIDREKDTSDSMEFGTLVHMKVLEPDLFNEKYTSAPEKTAENDLSLADLVSICKELGEKSSGTKRELAERIRHHKPEFKLYEELCDEMEKSGKQLLPPPMLKKINTIYDKIYSHPKVGPWIRLADKEKLGHFTDEKTGIIVPFCADAFFRHNDVGVVIDLKITKDWQPHRFQNTNFQEGRALQAAAYLRGISKIEGITFENFLFIAIEPKAPHRIRFYQLDQAAIEAGNIELDYYLAEFKERWTNKDWSPRPEDIEIQTTTYNSWNWDRINGMGDL